MSGLIRNMIRDNLVNIADILPLAILAPPAADADSIGVRHVLVLVRVQLTELADLHGDVLRARKQWAHHMQRITANERPAEEQLHTAFLADNDVTNQVRLTSIRLRELRTMEAQLVVQKARAVQLERQAAAAAAPHPAGQSVSLPKCKIPTFTGPGVKPSWTEFYELFRNGVHNDAVLPATRKMVYLKSFLDGDPAILIGGLEISDANYPVALNLLIEAYGSDTAVIRSLHQELVQLKPSSSFNDDVKLQLNLERVCMLLANRGQDVNGPHVWMSLEQKVTKPTYREVLNIKETERAANPGAVWDTTAFVERSN